MPILLVELEQVYGEIVETSRIILGLLDCHSVSNVLISAGNQPTRALGKYTRDEILHLSSVSPYETWKSSFATRWTWSSGFISWVIPCIDDRSQEIWRRSMELNSQRGPDSFMIMTIPNNIKRSLRPGRYARDLAVYCQLVCVTSSHRAKAIRIYNEMSDRTYAEPNTDSEINIICDKKRVRFPIRLYKNGTGKVAQGIWSVLHAPFHTNCADDTGSPPMALLFKLEPDTKRRKEHDPIHQTPHQLSLEGVELARASKEQMQGSKGKKKSSSLKTEFGKKRKRDDGGDDPEGEAGVHELQSRTSQMLGIGNEQRACQKDGVKKKKAAIRREQKKK
ncbi:hypothetical protein DFH09DRAFT_1102487 [Mycena vulgaris]|nr:hypothetical protein DFH09DRAFT_1102487 [Mycena vulgaris]